MKISTIISRILICASLILQCAQGYAVETVAPGTLVDNFDCTATAQLKDAYIQKSAAFAIPRQDHMVGQIPGKALLSNKLSLNLSEDLHLEYNIFLEFFIDSESKQAYESFALNTLIIQNGKSTHTMHPISLYLPVPKKDGWIQLHGGSQKLISPITNEEIGRLECVWLGMRPLLYIPLNKVP